MSVVIITIFFFVNSLGRLFSKFRTKYNMMTIIYIILGRFILYGLFITDAFVDNSILHSFYTILVGIILLAFTDGFCISSLFILARDEGINNKEMENFGYVMALSSTMGMMIGTFLALPFMIID